MAGLGPIGARPPAAPHPAVMMQFANHYRAPLGAPRARWAAGRPALEFQLAFASSEPAARAPTAARVGAGAQARREMRKCCQRCSNSRAGAPSRRPPRKFSPQVVKSRRASLQLAIGAQGCQPARQSCGRPASKREGEVGRRASCAPPSTCVRSEVEARAGSWPLAPSGPKPIDWRARGR